MLSGSRNMAVLDANELIKIGHFKFWHFLTLDKPLFPPKISVNINKQLVTYLLSMLFSSTPNVCYWFKTIIQLESFVVFLRNHINMRKFISPNEKLQGRVGADYRLARSCSSLIAHLDPADVFARPLPARASLLVLSVCVCVCIGGRAEEGKWRGHPSWFCC